MSGMVPHRSVSLVSTVIWRAGWRAGPSYIALKYLSKVLYSGKMLESPNYLASRERGEMVPMMTLNKFTDPEDEWSWWEKLQIMVKMATGDEFGNNNPALWRIGTMEDGVYLAVTDSKVPTRFNLSSWRHWASSIQPCIHSPSLDALTGCENRTRTIPSTST